LKTTNGGVNWISIPTQNQLRMRSLYLINENIAYASGEFNIVWGKILKTTNGGDNWDSLVIGFNNSLNCIYFINVNTGYVIGPTQRLVMMTTDGGLNWINKTLPSIYPLRIQCFGRDSCIIVGSPGVNYNGACFSSNGGQSWIDQQTPSISALRSLYMLNLNTGYAVGEVHQIIKTTNGGFTALSTSSEEIPIDYSLSQNFPNPFNPITNIQFSLPKSEFVNLQIYDVDGRLIENLIKRELNAGYYIYKWNAGNYSSGMYFFTLETESIKISKKMILVK
jgi:photosystem II stability/assembly factor-like uncharacterized protein